MEKDFYLEDEMSVESMVEKIQALSAINAFSKTQKKIANDLIDSLDNWDIRAWVDKISQLIKKIHTKKYANINDPMIEFLKGIRLQLQNLIISNCDVFDHDFCDQLSKEDFGLLSAFVDFIMFEDSISLEKSLSFFFEEDSKVKIAKNIDIFTKFLCKYEQLTDCPDLSEEDIEIMKKKIDDLYSIYSKSKKKTLSNNNLKNRFKNKKKDFEIHIKDLFAIFCDLDEFRDTQNPWEKYLLKFYDYLWDNNIIQIENQKRIMMDLVIVDIREDIVKSHNRRLIDEENSIQYEAEISRKREENKIKKQEKNQKLQENKIPEKEIYELDISIVEFLEKNFCATKSILRYFTRLHEKSIRINMEELLEKYPLKNNKLDPDSVKNSLLDFWFNIEEQENIEIKKETVEKSLNLVLNDSKEVLSEEEKKKIERKKINLNLDTLCFDKVFEVLRSCGIENYSNRFNTDFDNRIWKSNAEIKKAFITSLENVFFDKSWKYVWFVGNHKKIWVGTSGYRLIINTWANEVVWILNHDEWDLMIPNIYSEKKS